MKKNIIGLLLVFMALIGCNDKPEVEPILSQNLSVYPVPTSNLAHISVDNPGSSMFTLQVFNTKGEIILEKSVTSGMQNFTLPLSDEPAGKYQVILKSDKVVATQTIVKI